MYERLMNLQLIINDQNAKQFEILINIVKILSDESDELKIKIAELEKEIEALKCQKT